MFKSKRFIIIATIVVALGCIAWFYLLGGGLYTDVGLTVPVRKGEFVVRVRATGKLESADATHVETNAHWRILTFLAPEGKPVKKGEILARFDDSRLREAVLTRKNDLKMSNARRDEKIQQMAVRKQEIEARIAMLKADLAIKKTQYERLESLPLPDDVKSAELERDYRRSRHKLAREDLEIVQSLSARGAMVFSKEEVREKEHAYVEAEGELEKAENLVGKIREGASDAELDAAKRDFRKAEIDLTEAERRKPEQEISLEAGKLSANAEVEKMQVRLDRTTKELEKLRVKAPVDGILIYRTIRGRPIELGDQLRRRFHIFDISDMDKMVVRAKVSEADSSHVKVAQPVNVRVFSIPTKVLIGEVKEVAKIAKDKTADQGRRRHRRRGPPKTGIQVFDVIIEIKEKNPYLRPNVDAEVEIICQRIPDALSIPIDCVFEKEFDQGDKKVRRKVVRVLDGRSVVERVVELGVYGSDWVVVTKGLEAGESVIIRTPEGGGGRGE